MILSLDESSFAASIAPSMSAIGAKSVSVTHLDVYKRQDRISAAINEKPRQSGRALYYILKIS